MYKAFSNLSLYPTEDISLPFNLKDITGTSVNKNFLITSLMCLLNVKFYTHLSNV